MNPIKKNPLGRGLESLIPRGEAALPREEAGRLVDIGITDITPNNRQPRRDFDPEALHSLSESIRAKGIMQPLVVCKTEGRFMLISGERRLRAAALAGLKTVPALMIQPPDENERLELALIENTQRDDLKPLELAKAYQDLIEQWGYRQEDVARIAGKSRSAVANTMRLLDLFPFVADALEKKTLTEGHARAFLPLNENQAKTLLNTVINRKLSVRETEAAARRLMQPAKAQKTDDPDAHAFARELEEYFGLKINIKNRGKKGGLIEIRYHTADELDKIVNKIRGQSC